MYVWLPYVDEKSSCAINDNIIQVLRMQTKKRTTAENLLDDETLVLITISSFSEFLRYVFATLLVGSSIQFLHSTSPREIRDYMSSVVNVF